MERGVIGIYRLVDISKQSEGEQGRETATSTKNYTNSIIRTQM